MEEGKGIHVEYEAPGSFRPKANKDNDYGMDRIAQQEKPRLQRHLRVFGAGLFAAREYGCHPGS